MEENFKHTFWLIIFKENIWHIFMQSYSWHLIWIYIQIKIIILLLHMLFNDMVNLNLSIIHSGDISAYLLFCIFSTDFTFITVLIKVLSLAGYPGSSPHKFDIILKLTWKYVFSRKGVLKNINLLDEYAYEITLLHFE